MPNMSKLIKIQDRKLLAQAVLDASIDGFWVVNAKDGSILEANDVYCRLSGYSRAELLTMRVSDLDYLETQADTSVHIERIIRKGGDRFKTKHRCKNGEIWPVEVTVTYSDFDGGRFFVFLRDIRKRYANKAMLNLQLQLFELLHKNSMDALLQAAVTQAENLTNSQIGFFHVVEPDQLTISLQVWSPNTIKTFCSTHGMARHYPIAEAGVWVDCILQRCPVIHNDYAALPHKKGLPEGHPPVLRELVVPIFRNELIVAVLGVGNKTVNYTKTDIKLVRKIGDMVYEYVERKQADERVAFMAYYDALTKLPNRTLLLDRLTQAMAQTQRSGTLLALAYIDLDGFKPVNDRYGHAVGDEFLIAFAQRMSKVLRVGDTIARLGGDEFALILPNLAQIHDGEVILWRMLGTIAEPFCISAHEVRVGASIGFTIYPLDDTGADTLLHHADQAMYQAKWDGKNTVRLYDTAYNARLQIQNETIEELRQGFANDELVLYYQPIVDLACGKLIGTEASIRWNHPKRGLLQADEFVPALHGTPKAARLDKWLIHQALTQISIRDGMGKTLPISVNIHHDSLSKLEFLEFMKEQAVHWPHTVMAQLEIEMQLSAIGTDFAILTEVMVGCSQFGIRFTVDNYDVNHVSMAQLQHLPISRVKLDRRCVYQAVKSVDNLRLLNKSIDLVKDLPLPTIAQGVDNLIIAALLLDLGCTLGQGAIVAQPMPAVSISAWLNGGGINTYYRELHDLDLENHLDALLQVAIGAVRRWSTDIARFIDTNGQSPCPMLCTDQCPMSEWYNGLGLFRYGHRPGFAFQAARHRTLHLLAANIAELVEGGFVDQARANLAQFYNQRDELVDMLTRLGDNYF